MVSALTFGSILRRYVLTDQVVAPDPILGRKERYHCGFYAKYIFASMQILQLWR